MRSEERTRADQEEEYKQDHLDGRREGQQIDGGTYNGEEPFYLLYSLDVVYFYTDQKFKLDTDKSKKYNPSNQRGRSNSDHSKEAESSNQVLIWHPITTQAHALIQGE